MVEWNRLQNEYSAAEEEFKNLCEKDDLIRKLDELDKTTESRRDDASTVITELSDAISKSNLTLSKS